MSALVGTPSSLGTDYRGAAPQILSPIEGPSEVPEGDAVHLELSITPPGDLQVQWVKDGQPLNAGSRFNTACERGFASLDILYTLPEDSGTYSCTITNPHGQAQSQPVTVRVLAEVEPERDHIESHFTEATYSATSAPTRAYDRDQNAQPREAPTFDKQLEISDENILEGHPVRMEAFVRQTGDTTLRVEWVKDDQLVGTGSRFNTVFDRGYAVLEISYCLSEDTGAYKCVAMNAVGQAESRAVQLTCIAEARVVTQSLLDESSVNYLKQFDDPGEQYSHLYAEQTQSDPPSFKTALEPAQVQVKEDESVVFAVQVDCGSGHRVKVEWLRDNMIVKTGSRITGGIEMGLASLKIHYAQPADVGTYVCRVSTEHGQVDSNPATLECEVSGSIVKTSQLPGDQAKGLQALQTLEDLLNAPRGPGWVEEGPAAPPQILQQLQPVGELEEGSSVIFQVHVEPSTDPGLSVHWFKNEAELTSGTRFRVDYERGVATFNLMHLIPEDSGHYWCLARNMTGQIESNKVELTCNPSAKIITQSNLIEGSAGFELIKAIEEGAAGDGAEYRYMEEEEPDAQPVFEVKPHPATIAENAPVRFLVRVSGKPTPQLTWLLNGEPIVQDSMTRIFSDGPINHLEMNRCPAMKGDSILHVIAENPLGRAEAESTLTVVLAEDFRPDLKHVKPENPFRKMQVLRKVNCTDELNKALSKSKPSAQAIQEMERDTEFKARTYRSPETVEAEKMLDQLAFKLRKSEIRRPNPPTNGQPAEHQ